MPPFFPTDFTISQALPYVLWLLLPLLLWFYLRGVLPPAKVLEVFESEGVLSARQILAWVLAFYGMLQRQAGNLDNDGMWSCFEAAFILFGIGGVVKAAGKLKAPTTVKAKTAEVNAAPGSPVVVEGADPSETTPAPPRPEYRIDDE